MWTKAGLIFIVQQPRRYPGAPHKSNVARLLWDPGIWVVRGDEVGLDAEQLTKAVRRINELFSVRIRRRDLHVPTAGHVTLTGIICPGDCMWHSFLQCSGRLFVQTAMSPARKSPSLAKLCQRSCSPSSDNGQTCPGRCDAKSCPCWGPVAVWCSAAMSR